MRDPDSDDIRNEIAEVEIPIEWNRITIGAVTAVICEGAKKTQKKEIESCPKRTW